jgi:hypothetical protein
MVMIWAILAFSAGVTAAGAVVLVTLAGKRGDLYWAFLDRYPITGRLTKLAFCGFIVACGVAPSYWIIRFAGVP